jgi:hypothetical protein
MRIIAMKLPIVVQKEINTLLYDALPLCIILAYPDIQDWFLGHYLNIYSGIYKYDDGYKSIRLRYPESNVYLGPRKGCEILEYNPIHVESVMSATVNLQRGGVEN